MTDKQRHVQSNFCNQKERTHGLVLKTRTLRCQLPIKIGKESKFTAQSRPTRTNIFQPIMRVNSKKENPSPEFTPTCRSCGIKGILMQVREDNPNGNARRPYYKCIPCGRFLTFCDGRGLSPINPTCICGTPSRRQKNGQRHRIPGGVHYVCSTGRCRFYVVERDTDGGQLQIWKGLEELFIQKDYV
jgi:hypothetical protein